MNDAERKETHTGDTQLEEENEADAACELTVDHKLPHVGKVENVEYCVHRYGYAPTDKTVELTSHIPEITTKCLKGKEKKIVSTRNPFHLLCRQLR